MRLIDAAATQPLDHSRALGTHARTLELFEQFGFAEEAVKAAADMGAINMCSSRGTRGQIPLSVLKELDTPFPKFLGLPQVPSQAWCQLCCPHTAPYAAEDVPFAAGAGIVVCVGLEPEILLLGCDGAVCQSIVAGCCHAH